MRRVASGLAISAFAIFVLSDGSQVTDSRYTLALSERLLDHGSLDLAGVRDPDPPAGAGGSDAAFGADASLPYQLTAVGDHVRYRFPVGTSILATPVVAFLNLSGTRLIGNDGVYSFRTERRMQRRLAALAMALVAGLSFATAALRLPLVASAAITIAMMLGTSAWSSAARGLWSHTFGMLLTTAALYLLLRARVRDRPVPAATLATLLCWAYFARPLFALSLAAVVALLLLDPHRDAGNRRRVLIRFGFVTIAWLASFAWLSLQMHDTWFPAYFHLDRLSAGPSLERMVGQLLSPSRGLLVYSPFLLLLPWAAVRARAQLRDRDWIGVALGVVIAQWLVISSFEHWWGGHCFGPRLMTDAVPWFTLIAIFTWDGLLRAQREDPRRKSAGAMAALAIALTGLSIGIHSRAPEGMIWNVVPVSVDQSPERLWDWSDPPFLFERPSDDASPADSP